MGSVSALSAGAYTTTLYVMVDIVKKVVGVYPPHSPTRANFSIVMKCTTESGPCHSVYSLVLRSSFSLKMGSVLYTWTHSYKKDDETLLNLTGAMSRCSRKKVLIVHKIGVLVYTR
jgi:hypothetical protein